MKHSFKKWILVLLMGVFSHQGITKEDFDSKSRIASIALPVFGAVYSYLRCDYEGLKEITLASAFTAQTTTLLKNSVGRSRPNHEDDLSFPSGHAAAAFTGAAFMQHRYGWGWGIPMYTAATLISLERVSTRKHYWTDVIAGAALGYLSGYLFSAEYPNVWLESNFDSENKAVGIGFQARF